MSVNLHFRRKGQHKRQLARSRESRQEKQQRPQLKAREAQRVQLQQHPRSSALHKMRSRNLNPCSRTTQFLPPAPSKE
ncbi:MAG: hypothetical protein ACRC1U_06435, partial [Vibrionaceae bacterium]